MTYTPVDITASSTLINAIPWGGYKTIFVEPKNSYSGGDYIDFTGIFSNIDGAFALKTTAVSGPIQTVTWSNVTKRVALTNAGYTMVVVAGTI